MMETPGTTEDPLPPWPLLQEENPWSCFLCGEKLGCGPGMVVPPGAGAAGIFHVVQDWEGGRERERPWRVLEVNVERENETD